MKKSIITFSIFIFSFLIISFTVATAQSSQETPSAVTAEMTGTAITYQGYLEDSSGPITDNCDFQFSIFGSADGTDQIGLTQTHPNEWVENGYFTVGYIDFGSNVFQGDQRFLEIAVSCPSGSGSYSTLSPRQAIMPAPYALALPGLWTQQTSPSPNLIGGYSGNQIATDVWGATIGGGGSDDWGPNRVTDRFGTIAGGVNNQVGNDLGMIDISDLATIGGGGDNAAHGWASTISGGYSNTITNTANAATIGGGQNNIITGDWTNTISGGDSNTASGYWNATVAGGAQNTASESESTVGGGAENTASGVFSTVGGGYQNTASGWGAFVAGGVGNQASGDTSFAAGHNAQANHNGAFVWADNTGTGVASTTDNQFNVYASGGVNFQTDGAPFMINGASPGPYANVVVVAKSGGDFTSIQGALDSITASASNPYLVWVAPGVYTETVTMKEWVDIEGSGEGVTKITYSGNTSYETGTVVGANNTELRFMTVENTGGELNAVAIYNSSVSPRLIHVTANASGGDFNIGVSNNGSSPLMSNMTASASGDGHNEGVFNNAGSSSLMSNVTASASGGNLNYGVYNQGSSPTMSIVIASASGGSRNYGVYTRDSSAPTISNVTASATGDGENYGVFNEESSPTMLNVTASTSGAGENYGVYNFRASPMMSNVTASASGGISNYGLYNWQSWPTIHDSTLNGTQYGIYNDAYSGSYNVIVNNSQISGATNTIRNNSFFTNLVGASLLDGGAVNPNGGTVTCAGVYDENYTFYTNTCP